MSDVWVRSYSPRLPCLSRFPRNTTTSISSGHRSPSHPAHLPLDGAHQVAETIAPPPIALPQTPLFSCLAVQMAPQCSPSTTSGSSKSPARSPPTSHQITPLAAGLVNPSATHPDLASTRLPPSWAPTSFLSADAIRPPILATYVLIPIPMSSTQVLRLLRYPLPPVLPLDTVAHSSSILPLPPHPLVLKFFSSSALLTLPIGTTKAVSNREKLRS